MVALAAAGYGSPMVSEYRRAVQSYEIWNALLCHHRRQWSSPSDLITGASALEFHQRNGHYSTTTPGWAPAASIPPQIPHHSIVSPKPMGFSYGQSMSIRITFAAGGSLNPVRCILCSRLPPRSQSCLLISKLITRMHAKGSPD